MNNFTIFGKDLLNPRSRYALLTYNKVINENPKLDTIIPIENGFNTDHLIIKGFQDITLCIYGKDAES